MQRVRRRAEPVRDRVAEEGDRVGAADVDLDGAEEVPGRRRLAVPLPGRVPGQVPLAPVAGREGLGVEGRRAGGGVEVQGDGHRLPGGDGEPDVVADDLPARRDLHLPSAPEGERRERVRRHGGPAARTAHVRRRDPHRGHAVRVRQPYPDPVAARAEPDDLTQRLAPEALPGPVGGEALAGELG
jgi:hypothetical protein